MTPVEMARLHAAAMPAREAWSADSIEALLASAGTFAVSQGGAGFAIGRVAADEAELLTLAVDPGARRKGHGRACLDGFHQAARDRGARIAFLEVAETNLAARALYDQAGYALAGRRRAYYRGPPAADALLLQRALA